MTTSADTQRPDPSGGSTSPPERISVTEARERLRHERDTRLAQLRAAEDPGTHTGDVAAEQRHAVERVLREIDAAFVRLDEGSYGDCRACGRRIPDERLEILPYASHCVACQTRSVRPWSV